MIYVIFITSLCYVTWFRFISVSISNLIEGNETIIVTISLSSTKSQERYIDNAQKKLVIAM